MLGFRSLRLAVVCLAINAWVHAAQAGLNYSQLIVFGDSLSDTGNFADATESSFGLRYPGGDFNYADGRFTDGTGTTPAATQHQGVWHEQLAQLFLGLTPATASLDGGLDYAYGDAKTLDGRRNVAAGGGPIQIDDMGQQVTNYLTSHATADPQALYIVWGGANDLFGDSSAGNVAATAQRETALLRRLAEAGVKTLLVPNLPPLGQTPAYSGNASQSAALNQASSSFRDQLNADLDGLQTVLANEGLKVTIYRLDLYSLFNNLTAGNAASDGFTNVTTSAQGEAVPADSFLFWDAIHPTATGHYEIAAQAYTLLADAPVVKLAVALDATSGSAGARPLDVTLTGIPGRVYRLQSSDDLANWTARGSLAPDATTGRAVFVDPAPRPPRRFYRVVQP